MCKQIETPHQQKENVEILRELATILDNSTTPPVCQHSKTFTFNPELVTWQNNGKEMGPLTHGAKITGCMNCGKIWASNYAE